MTFQRTGALVAAIALALLGTLGLTAYVHSAKERAVAGEKLVDVYVASGTITAGTPASQLHSKVKLESVPAKVRATDAITNLTSIDGRVASTQIEPGEQLLASRFIAVGAQASQVQSSIAVPPGLFQSTISLDPDQALGGQIRAGNRVVVLAMPPALGTTTATTTPATAQIIARDVLVTTVQIDGSKGQGADPKAEVTTAATGKFLVTLALTQPDLEAVVTAVSNNTSSNGSSTVWLAAVPGTK
jgi:pilus assembly protein CpaB